MKNKLIFALITLIFTIPFIYIIISTNMELEKYKQGPRIEIKDLGYGDGVLVTVGDISEYIAGDLEVVSNETYFEICTKCYSFDILKYLSVDDEVRTGDLLFKDNKVEYYATRNGIIKEVRDSLMKLESTDNLKIKVDFDNNLSFATPTTINFNDRASNSPYTTTILYESQVSSKKRTAFYSMPENFNYKLKTKQKIDIFTGKTATNILKVPKETVYYDNSSQSYMVQLLDEKGYVLGQVPVEIGIIGVFDIEVLNLKEGDICDIEYGKFRNSDTLTVTTNEEVSKDE